MKKHITEVETNGGSLNKATCAELRRKAGKERLTIGLDLGDRDSAYCILSEQGEVLLRGRVATTKAGLGHVFAHLASCLVALEVGTHSPWMSRYLAQLGHEVIVANPRELAYITRSTRKNDRLDAEKLARLARADVKLLCPIRHRSESAQMDLAVLQMRDAAVRQRSQILARVRMRVKSLGERLKPCAPEAAGLWMVEESRPEIRRFTEPMLRVLETLNEQITVYEQEIAAMSKRYPVAVLQQVYGVGPLIALAMILTIDDPYRFRRSREIGPFLGFRPKKRDSGNSRPELGISKEGDKMLRWLLVQGAHTILRRGAPDSDLRRWGQGLLAEAEKARKKTGQRRGCKKKVVVAVARKLAVLLHHLWVTGEVYEPLHHARPAVAAAA